MQETSRCKKRICPCFFLFPDSDRDPFLVLYFLLWVVIVADSGAGRGGGVGKGEQEQSTTTTTVVEQRTRAE